LRPSWSGCGTPEWAARLAVLAQDELAGGDGLLVAGEGLDAAALDRRLRDAVPEAEGVLRFLVSAERVGAEESHPAGRVELVHRGAHRAGQGAFVGRVDGERDVAAAIPEPFVPVLRGVLTDIPQDVGPRGHALLERHRKLARDSSGKPSAWSPAKLTATPVHDSRSSVNPAAEGMCGARRAIRSRPPAGSST
jgi:hypothetical protein